MLLATALATLSLHLASATPARNGPVIDVERAPWVAKAHAVLVQDAGKTVLAVDMRTRFPALASRRTVTVEGLAPDGKVLFTRSAVARAGMNDARYHRAVDTRVSVELPALDGVVKLVVSAGR